MIEQMTPGQTEDAPEEKNLQKETEVTERTAPNKRQREEETGSTITASNDSISLATKWSRLVLQSFHRPIVSALCSISRMAATHPKKVICAVPSFSLVVMVIGLFTNFYVEVDEHFLWTPRDSKPVQHRKWLEGSGFPQEPRDLLITLHKNGDNVLGQEGVRRVFEVITLTEETKGFYGICPDADACPLEAVTNFWNGTLAIFEDQVDSDQDAITQMSAKSFPGGSPVDVPAILGNPVYDDDGALESSQIYIIYYELPDTDEAEDFEEPLIDRLLEMRDVWKAEGSEFRLELFAERSFSDEFERAIIKDIPLVPGIFVVMSIFACSYFFKWDRVQSRSLLGFGAVICVLLSIITSFGLLFIIGVPFTSITQILTFVMFGIGLDDAFIIAGSFYRMNPKRDVKQRIQETMEDVGMSITLTTLTSAVAFGLGCLSSVPAVYWLCLYAFPTIIIDFIYQITFFVALVVVDEKRVQDNRRDWLVCVKVNPRPEDEQGAQEDHGTEDLSIPAIDRFMVWYARQLERTWIKVVVILAFTGLFAGCAYSASLLTQEFTFTDVVPADSYVTDFWDVYDVYSSRAGFVTRVYFRDVDQAEERVHSQMYDYIEDLVALEQIPEGPAFFWLRDFEIFVESNDEGGLWNATFPEKMELFLAYPSYSAYSYDIVLDDSGYVSASRVSLYMSNIDLNGNIDALLDQRHVSKSQPINQGKSDWSFFTFAPLYSIWEFYSVAVEELVLSTVIGIFSVSVIALLLIPHWTAVLFVAPSLSILYIELLGVLQFAGFHINAISYVAMVMSIGLLVDFIMHVLLRYFQVPGSRQEKTREMLRTMGSSVFVGGLSTFLGVIPLAFSTSGIFKTTFTIFIGMVTLGIGHGLILFPVVLSLVGPTDHVEGVRLIHTILEKENIEEEEEEGAAVIVDKLSTQNELEEADVMNKDVSRLEMVRENETDDDVMHA